MLHELRRTDHECRYNYNKSPCTFWVKNDHTERNISFHEVFTCEQYELLVF